jgi:predicted negative regulator of RcsB-dependent stress response
MRTERDYETEQRRLFIFWTTLGGIVLVVALLWGLYGYPHWRIWAAEKRGAASYAEAEQDRRIKVTEASANAEAATLQAKATVAQAEARAAAHVKEAEGIAEANRIIGKSLQDNPDYLKYLWVQQLEKNGNTIYVPIGTGGLPLMLGTK